MKLSSFVAIVATLGTTLGALPAARANVTLVDNDKTVEVDCAKDPEVNLIGNHLTVTTKGVCARIAISGNDETVSGSAGTVYVNGNHNTVTLAAADDVAINGNHNTVTVRKAIKAKAPRISNPGNDNRVTQPK
ncbi:MAG TPA: DUF3060 domain-containing protein [Kofleriaceae bacterium]